MVGMSLGRTRLLLRRGTGDRRRVWDIPLEPRSAYVLA
jgi:alkylated DNA repair dioxygenase AlkB